MNWNSTSSRFLLYNATDLATRTVSDDPTVYGLPAFGDGSGNPASEWDKPITVSAVANADNLAFTTNVQGFQAPLVLTVERKRYRISPTPKTFVEDTGVLQAGQIWLLSFGTSFVPAQTSLNGKYVKFFLEKDVAFQFAKVEIGRAHV